MKRHFMRNTVRVRNRIYEIIGKRIILCDGIILYCWALKKNRCSWKYPASTESSGGATRSRLHRLAG